MTRLLPDTLREHADAAPGPQLDLDAIVRSGRRRVRRTRLVAGLAATAVAAVVTGGVTVLPRLAGPEPAGRAAASGPDFHERRVSYAVGDVIHWGQVSFNVGVDVRAFVQTDDGFAFTSEDGTVRLYDGVRATTIGHSANGSLRADDTGSLVAWVDLAEDKHPQYVVYDTAAREELARVDDHAAGPGTGEDDGGSFVYAVDDGKVYWRTFAGAVRYDVTTGESQVIAPLREPSDGKDQEPRLRTVVDVANGRIAYGVSSTSDGDAMLVGTSIGPEARAMPMGWSGVLSPDGRYIGVEDADRLGIYDTATAATAVPPGLGRYPFKVVYGWVDADTAMLFAIKDVSQGEPYEFDLLSCDIPDGGCTEVSSGTTPDRAEDLVLPTGDPMT